MNNQISPDFSNVLRSIPTGTPKVMLTVRRDGLQTEVRINSSSLHLLQTCARKSFYTLKEGWRSRSGSPPLIFGTAIHKAMEVFYNQPRGERNVPDNFEEHALGMVNGQEDPCNHFLYDAIAGFIKEAELLRHLPDTDKHSLSSGVWVLGHYFRTYINDTYEIYRDEHGPITERTFETPIFEDGSLKIILFGTIDVVLRNSATGDILPADHKTFSQAYDFLNKVKPNHQYTGYLMGANKVLGLQCDNFLVNGVMKKSRPLTARGGPPSFTRQITHRNEEDFQEFIDAVEYAVRDYLNWEATGKWPIGTTDACASYGGCGFLDVCSAPILLRDNILSAKYQQGNV